MKISYDDVKYASERDYRKVPRMTLDEAENVFLKMIKSVEKFDKHYKSVVYEILLENGKSIKIDFRRNALNHILGLPSASTLAQNNVISFSYKDNPSVNSYTILKDIARDYKEYAILNQMQGNNCFNYHRMNFKNEVFLATSDYQSADYGVVMLNNRNDNVSIKGDIFIVTRVLNSYYPYAAMSLSKGDKDYYYVESVFPTSFENTMFKDQKMLGVSGVITRFNGNTTGILYNDKELEYNASIVNEFNENYNKSKGL